MIKSLMLTSLAFLTLGFGTGSYTPPAQDRCAELSANGYPLYCSPTGPDAPYWGEDICCDGAKCLEKETESAGCPENTQNYWCRYAELDGLGGVTCLFEVEMYCDSHDCPDPAPGYQPQPQGNAMCCYEGGCYDPHGGICGGVLYWCDDGVSNIDGTVTCFDEDTP